MLRLTACDRNVNFSIRVFKAFSKTRNSLLLTRLRKGAAGFSPAACKQWEVLFLRNPKKHSAVVNTALCPLLEHATLLLSPDPRFPLRTSHRSFCSNIVGRPSCFQAGQALIGIRMQDSSHDWAAAHSARSLAGFRDSQFAKRRMSCNNASPGSRCEHQRFSFRCCSPPRFPYLARCRAPEPSREQ